MDDQRFDRLVRALGSRATRRGAAFGFAAFVGLASDAAARKKPSKNQRAKRSKKRGGKKKDTVLICHKPGTPAEQTLLVSRSAVNAHLGHGDHLDSCCPYDHVFCDGYCCPPPPQGGKAKCCSDGSCGCAETCCQNACFYDDKGGSSPAEEFCCVALDGNICPLPEQPDSKPTDEEKATCCPANDVSCSCAEATGIAGSYRRPGR